MAETACQTRKDTIVDHVCHVVSIVPVNARDTSASIRRDWRPLATHLIAGNLIESMVVIGDLS